MSRIERIPVRLWPTPGPDVGAASTLAAAVLLLAAGWSASGVSTVPAAAWISVLGVGVGAYLLISAATHRHPGRAAELRGLLTTVGMLAATGFVLRLEPDAAGARLEWALFTAGVVVFFAAGETGARIRWTTGLWWVLGGLPAIAAVGLVLAHGLAGTRAAALIALAAPLPVLAAALVALAAAGATRWRRSPVPPVELQTWAVVFPPVAVFAFTRDPGALFLIGLPLCTVLVTAHLTVWRTAGRLIRRLPTVVATVATSSFVLVAGLIRLYPDPQFSITGPPAARDLFGVARPADPHGAVLSATTEKVVGRGGLAVLVLITMLLVAQIILLVDAAFARREPGRSDFVLLGAVGLAAQLTVSLAGPVLSATGLTVPAGLATLPVASDGAGFIVTLAVLGLLFGVGNRSPRGAT